jgi:hypothetical protein
MIDSEEHWAQNEGCEPPDATALLGIPVPGRSGSRREFALMSYRDAGPSLDPRELRDLAFAARRGLADFDFAAARGL